VNGKSNKVLLRDVQMHPFKPLVLHIDFQRVDANTVKTTVVLTPMRGLD
jgi:large subunit ribosomal protein L25